MLCFFLFGACSIWLPGLLPALWNTYLPWFGGSIGFGFLVFFSDPSLPLKDTLPLRSCLGWLFYPCPWGISSILLVCTIIDMLLTLKSKSPVHFSLQNPRLTYSITSRISLYRCATAYRNQYFQTYFSMTQCLAQNRCSHIYVHIMYYNCQRSCPSLPDYKYLESTDSVFLKTCCLLSIQHSVCHLVDASMLPEWTRIENKSLDFKGVRGDSKIEVRERIYGSILVIIAWQIIPKHSGLKHLFILLLIWGSEI